MTTIFFLPLGASHYAYETSRKSRDCYNIYPDRKASVSAILIFFTDGMFLMKEKMSLVPYGVNSGLLKSLEISRNTGLAFSAVTADRTAVCE